ncbi:MAG: helix-turn-helix transcriptional regulator [Acidobacteria bacterium]|nr:helix-turn-helix transcriptional regulator [Acidobacteriota bacterium]
MTLIVGASRPHRDQDAYLAEVAFTKLVFARAKELGMSQKELAAKSGLSRTFLYSVSQNEKGLSFEAAFMLARAVGLSFPGELPQPKSLTAAKEAALAVAKLIVSYVRNGVPAGEGQDPFVTQPAVAELARRLEEFKGTP